MYAQAGSSKFWLLNEDSVGRRFSMPENNRPGFTSYNMQLTPLDYKRAQILPPVFTCMPRGNNTDTLKNSLLQISAAGFNGKGTYNYLPALNFVHSTPSLKVTAGIHSFNDKETGELFLSSYFADSKNTHTDTAAVQNKANAVVFNVNTAYRPNKFIEIGADANGYYDKLAAKYLRQDEFSENHNISNNNKNFAVGGYIKLSDGSAHNNLTMYGRYAKHNLVESLYAIKKYNG